jgi:hypothetical protein
MWLNVGQGATNVGGFSGASYWSSSEFDQNNAWAQTGGGFQYYDAKLIPNYVRAVRAF